MAIARPIDKPIVLNNVISNIKLRSAAGSKKLTVNNPTLTPSTPIQAYVGFVIERKSNKNCLYTNGSTSAEASVFWQQQ
ncbi:MAG: hypothetical protein ACJAYR_003444 [Sneathiella sp.]|jgi:hypothetical protein